ncbi:MAG: MG2 domain-containing protein [Promethearchaeota archaeon]
MNKRNKASIFLIIISIQYLFIGLTPVNFVNGYDNEPEELNGIHSKNNGISHSSPYYFPTNISTPLMTEESVEEQTKESLKQASYDYNNEHVLTINLEKYVLTIGETVVINLALSFNLNAIGGEIITLEIYKGYYRDYSWYDDMVPIYSTYLTTDSNGQASLSFNSNIETGIFTVYAYVEECKSYEEFMIGNVGIFLKGPMYFKSGHEYTATVHLVNTSDFTGIPLSTFNYSFSYYVYSLSSWITLITEEVQTDNYGYAIFKTEIPSEINIGYLKLAIRTSDGEAEYETCLYESWDYYYYYALWGGQKKTNQDKTQYVVTTDKTIYSPGDTIHIRVLVLEYSFMNETKRALKNKLIPLTIYNPDDLTIFWTSLITDEYGIITYALPLDNDCELGLYGFEFGDFNAIYRYNVRVDLYTKPVFRVEIETGGKDYYSPSDSIYEGYVYVSYYFGQPVVDASVELTIFNYMGEMKKTIEGYTNGEGRFYFSINLADIHDLDYSFRVEVNVEDTYSRNASTNKVYTRIKDIFAYGYLSNWAPLPDETLKYYYYVYQYVMISESLGYSYWNQNPLVNVSVKIEIYGIKGYSWSRSGIKNEKLLASYQGTTNIFGAGTLEFALPLDQIRNYDLFEIRLKVLLEDKRSTISSYYYRYKKYSLDIIIADSNLEQGMTLEFDVTYKNTLTDTPCEGEGIINIYDSNYQLIGRVNEIIDGTKTYSLSIPNFYPSGIYYIHSFIYSRSNDYYGGFSYHSAHTTFRVGNIQSISFSTNFTSTGRYYDEIFVQQDDIIEIKGSSNVSTNLPHYLEIYKRGLLFSITLEVIDGKFSYILPITELYAPEFTIMVYTISELGEIYEYALLVHVETSYGFEISTDKNVYEPGDSVTLTITPSENTTSIFAVSFIDSAVLDVEPEDDSELGYFTMNTYSMYIRSGSSWGSGFDANHYWWYWGGLHTGGIYYLGIPDLLRSFGDTYNYLCEYLDDYQEIIPPSFDDLLEEFDTEIRTNISESANWTPRMIISEPTNITFALPDNIGEWTIRVVGNSISEYSNNIVLGGDVETLQIKTYLPFFIEFDLPQPISQDDILTVKGYIYNYLGIDVTAYVAIEAPNLVILNNDVQELTIPDRFVSEVEFSVYCKEPYFQNITLLAATEASGIKYSDAKLLTTYIQPNGIEIINRTIGYLNNSNSPLILDYYLDPLAIYHKETISLYTDLMDISIDSWQMLIGYPYGCIEQTLSKLLPTALIYNYLKQTGQLTSSLEEELTLMILEGLARVYNFQHTDGGWGWWKDDSCKIIMTAIVVSALNQINKTGIYVNPVVIRNGIEYLISHQHSDGSWDFQEYSSNTLEATAYIVKTLLNYYNITSEIDASINKAITKFKSLWNTGEMNSPYAASLFYIATMGTSYQNTILNDELIQYIKDTKKTEGNTIFWDSDQSNNWYWRKLGNEIEITAFATWALAIDDFITNYPTIQNAIRYLLNQRNRWGWRTTADTSAVITALTAIKSIASTGGFIDFNGLISVSINDHYPPQYLLNFTDDTNIPSEIQLNLAEFINVGSNTLNITLDGSGQICYILETIQILRSNPKIEIPDTIKISKNEQFDLAIKFLDVDDRMPIINSMISLVNLPQELQIPFENYSLELPILINGTEISFSLLAPNRTGDFVIEGISVFGFIQFIDISHNSSDYQLFQQTVGPIVIKVLEQNPIPAFNSKSSKYELDPLFEGIQSSAPDTNESLTLLKQVSKQDSLFPGDIITSTITISNDGEPCQFYVVEDEIPTGTIFISDSVEISGVASNSEITFDVYANHINIFFPLLPSGTTEITYQLQVEGIKNSYSGQCILWGMYDNTYIVSQSVILENIPRKYYSNHSLYQDQVEPSLSDISIDQNDISQRIELNIKLNAIDNNNIYKIRVIFSQISGWRVQTFYAVENQEEFSFSLTEFENIDSNVKIFFEIYDMYGNVATTEMRIIHVIEFIPYVIIGVIIGLSIGIAGLISVLTKKFETKRLSSQKELIDKEKRKLTFLDPSEDTYEEPQ